MFTILTTIWFLHIAATVTPGTNTLLVAQLAAGSSYPCAIFAAVGVAVGSAIWAVFAVLGVNFIFSVFPVLRLALQIAGGLYLLYIAFRLWSSVSTSTVAGAKLLTPVAAFRLGVLTNFTNPKAAMFFGSIFSACFPASPAPALLVAAVLVVFVNALCWYALLALVFGRGSVRATYMRKRRVLDKVAGVVFGALGLRFLLMSLREAGTKTAA